MNVNYQKIVKRMEKLLNFTKMVIKDMKDFLLISNIQVRELNILKRKY